MFGLRARLVLLSALMLFVELALIRWTGANILYLSYFSNFVLLGSFLGIGIGFLRGRGATDLFPWAAPALALFVVAVVLSPVEVNRPGGELLFFGGRPSGPPAWAVLPVIFGAVALVMATLAQGVARAFGNFEPLEAYRLDIVGSILGIAAFSALSFLHAPPLGWGAVAAVLLLALYGRPRLLQVASVVVLLAALTLETTAPYESWSPYYRVTNQPYVTASGERYWNVNVNGIPHQLVLPTEKRRVTEPQYFIPYERRAATGPLEDVLVIGAGNGTDVAIALRNAAKRIDAVEIDPRIAQIGRELHPDRPYQDPRVTVHIDDGRAFLERSDRRYDLILFALPDSLVLVAGQSALRLESYLFTQEAMQAVRDHLKPGGVFAMYNYYRETWLIDRYAATIERAFGSTPCVDHFQAQFAVLTAGVGAGDVRCPTERAVVAAPEPSTDDHPFPYLRTRTIPAVYLIAIALILAASILLIRGAAGPLRQMRPFTDLFFMGAAFLLLETKNVVQFALLFGTTWFVNALVFGGILISVLIAIEVARRLPAISPRVLYVALFVTIAIAYVVPQASLLSLAIVPRFVAAVLLAFTPIFLANLIFAERFRRVEASTTAFGANLLGAMVGGALEYASLVIGFRALLIVVAVLYACAYLTTPRAVPAGT